MVTVVERRHDLLGEQAVALRGVLVVTYPGFPRALAGDRPADAGLVVELPVVDVKVVPARCPLGRSVSSSATALYGIAGGTVNVCRTLRRDCDIGNGQLRALRRRHPCAPGDADDRGRRVTARGREADHELLYLLSSAARGRFPPADGAASVMHEQPALAAHPRVQRAVQYRTDLPVSMDREQPRTSCTMVAEVVRSLVSVSASRVERGPSTPSWQNCRATHYPQRARRWIRGRV